jgi:hypothetical protein
MCTKQDPRSAAAALGLFVALDAGLSASRPRSQSGAAPLVVFAVAAAAPLAATFAVLAAHGTLGDFWVQGVLSPLHGARMAATSACRRSCRSSVKTPSCAGTWSTTCRRSSSTRARRRSPGAGSIAPRRSSTWA